MPADSLPVVMAVPPLTAVAVADHRRAQHRPDPINPHQCVTCQLPRPCPGLAAIAAVVDADHLPTRHTAERGPASTSPAPCRPVPANINAERPHPNANT